MTRLLTLAAVVALAASVCPADVFYVNRDAGLNSGTAYDNQGARSVVRSAKWGADESYLMDFDTAAILAYLNGDPISDYTFKLYIKPSSGWPATPVSVNVQTVNLNVDWAEGDDPNRFNSFGWTEGTPACTAEYCQTYYTAGPVLDTENSITWQRENGTPESEFKYLPANYTNSAALVGSSADHGIYISVELDENLINDLLNNAKNRGLRLHRNAGDNLENYTREAVSGNRPYLEVTPKGTQPTVSVAFVYQAGTNGSEAVSTVRLPVALSETSSQTITVNYGATGGTAVGGGVDYTLSAGQLQFDPGELIAEIVFSVVNDPDTEGDETIQITLSNPVNAQLGVPSQHVYTINDNDRTGTTWNVSTIGQFNTAMESCQPGDEIVVAAGTYTLDANSNRRRLDVHDVILRGATGNAADVVLTGPGMNVDLQPTEGLLVEADDVTVMDLTVANLWSNGIHIRAEIDIDRMLLSNVRTLNIGERHVKGSAGNALITKDCVLDNVYMLQTEARQSRPGHPVDPDNYIGGMDIMTSRNWLVRDCTMEGIWGATGAGRGAIFMWNGVEDVTIERNRIFDCGTGICIGNPSGPANSHVDPWHSLGGIVRNNFVLRGSYIALELCNTKDMKVYNNTIYSNDATYFRTLHIYDEPGEGQTTNLDLCNNIIRGKIFDNSSGDWSKSAVIAMGNIVDDAGTQVVPGWFTDTSIGDFHLTASATGAIDQGSVLADVTDDFDQEPRGSQPDMGGDESNPPGGLPTVTLTATDPNAAEQGQDTGTFTVSRDQTSGALVVKYSVGGSAASGDYEETLSGQVTIPDGQASAPITITPVDDS
ncbi:MAG TPA: Calx-beta domain-containing protein, partial [Phycisphaerae bacterium]|nr:Calx-beta domain-containing protein [Phycisphaerae bacterium]